MVSFGLKICHSHKGQGFVYMHETTKYVVINMHKMIHFSRIKNYKKVCVPTLPNIFRPVTQNTLFFLFGLRLNQILHYIRQCIDCIINDAHLYFSLLVC